MVAAYKKVFNLICICIFCVINYAYADSTESDLKSFSPTESKYVNWVFLGEVENEIGESYNYFFQLQRNSQDFHVKVALFDANNKKLIFKEDSSITLDDESGNRWLIGKAFLKYYKTSNSWVFGLKTPNKEGFNFKVSMLNKAEDVPVTRYLKEGISFIAMQAGRLNGNINSGDTDQFVTSKNNLFMQIWLAKDPTTTQNLSSLLCRLQDGVGLYTIKSSGKNNVGSNIVGLFDGEGNILRVSQFINIQKNQDNDLNIDVLTPKMSLKLKDSYQDNDLIAGYAMNDKANGFCILSNTQIGSIFRSRS